MSKLKELIAIGHEQGYLLKGDILKVLPDEIADKEQIEDIMQMIKDMNIEIHDASPKDS